MLKITSLIVILGIIPCIVCQFGGAEVMAFSSLTVEKASATVSDPMVLLNNTLTCFDEPTRTVVCGKHTENGETTYKVFWSECHFENQNSFLALQNGNDAVSFEKVNCTEAHKKYGHHAKSN